MSASRPRSRHNQHAIAPTAAAGSLDEMKSLGKSRRTRTVGGGRARVYGPLAMKPSHQCGEVAQCEGFVSSATSAAVPESFVDDGDNNVTGGVAL